jgi:hypothetical protein
MAMMETNVSQSTTCSTSAPILVLGADLPVDACGLIHHYFLNFNIICSSLVSHCGRNITQGQGHIESQTTNGCE